jgi:hypothetical protein
MISEQGTYKLLLHGIDTVQCAYYLTPPASKHLDFQSPRSHQRTASDE